MGMLIDGVWREEGRIPKDSAGRFMRQEAAFRNWITADGGAGSSGEDGFRAEPGRYHLYVSLACPWAHRTLIVRRLKGLEKAIGLSVADPFMGARGWAFTDGPGCIPDTVNGMAYVHELYQRARPGHTGRASVPVLWDKARKTIVSNESSEIIRMFNTAFDQWGEAGLDLYPAELRAEIDAINARVYSDVNNGVYRCGFADTQEAYEEAFNSLFATLGWLEELLAEKRYLTGTRITEADWRLFTTLVRFDAVYVGHFKCNLRRIADYPNLCNYLRELYRIPGISSTVNMSHIKQHYYRSHASLNPRRIVPRGPALDLEAPHDRARLPGEQVCAG